MAVIECDDVTKSYGGLVAVNKLSFAVEEGEFFAIVGPNGAGKTTLFDTISGHARASSGTILFGSEPIQNASPNQICRKGLARTFQTTTSFESQNVLTNVLLAAVFGRGGGKARWMRYDDEAIAATLEALELMDLLGVQHEQAGTLPILARKRLMLASAMATRPRLLLLDEPVGGLNSEEREEFVELIGRVAASGVTVLMIEHVMKAVQALATRMLVLHHGEKIAEGRPAEVLRDERVVEIYLGGASAAPQRNGGEP